LAKIFHASSFARKPKFQVEITMGFVTLACLAKADAMGNADAAALSCKNFLRVVFT
jgi:hypothetical protein